MNIQIPTKIENHLKKILKTNDIQSIIQKVIEDWIKNTIRMKWESIKTVDEIIDESNKE